MRVILQLTAFLTEAIDRGTYQWCNGVIGYRADYYLPKIPQHRLAILKYVSSLKSMIKNVTKLEIVVRDE